MTIYTTIEETDSRGNIIHGAYSNGYEYWNEYDENNNIIHYNNTDGVEYWKEYDDDKNLTYHETNTGFLFGERRNPMVGNIL